MAVTQNPPQVYAEWVPVLRRFAAMEDDPHTLTQMRRGTLVFDDAVSKRFVDRFIDAIQDRMGAQAVAAASRIARSKNQSDIIATLRSLKTQYREDSRAVQLQFFPPNISSEFVNLVKREATDTQQTLIKTFGSVDDTILELIKQNPVNDF